MATARCTACGAAPSIPPRAATAFARPLSAPCRNCFPRPTRIAANSAASASASAAPPTTPPTVIKSHHYIAGWHGFPLAQWLTEFLGLPTIICNDADVAGLAEATFGAGAGLSPIFYMTIGTGIGGGLVIDGEIYRGMGKGACEIGHLTIRGEAILESFSAGWGIEARAKRLAAGDPRDAALRQAVGRDPTVKDIAAAARGGDPAANECLDLAIAALAEGIQQAIKLLCPRRIVIGGGVSLIGAERFFAPLRKLVAGAGPSKPLRD